MAIERFKLIYQDRKQIAPNVHHLGFVREDGKPLLFSPGHFITFLLPSEDGVKRRSYSLATLLAPGDVSDRVEVAVSYVEDGVASKLFLGLKGGEVLDAMGPAGRLIMADYAAKRYVLVGTGTGIAPYRAMLPELSERLNKQADFKVMLLQGVQYRADLIYQKDFLNVMHQNTRFKYQAFLSQDMLENQQDYERKGYVQSAFDALELDSERDVVFLCGNPNMIDDAYALLKEQGFDNKSVRREKYISSN
jgi:ferredoxin-NADP reductase